MSYCLSKQGWYTLIFIEKIINFICVYFSRLLEWQLYTVYTWVCFKRFVKIIVHFEEIHRSMLSVDLSPVTVSILNLSVVYNVFCR